MEEGKERGVPCERRGFPHDSNDRAQGMGMGSMNLAEYCLSSIEAERRQNGKMSDVRCEAGRMEPVLSSVDSPAISPADGRGKGYQN